MIYLASPYWHPCAATRNARFKAACRATVDLMRAGHFVFSPVVHGHPLTVYDVPGGWEFWRPHDLEHMRRCDEVVVLTLGSWRESLGVQAEIRFANELGKPIRYMSPEERDVCAVSPRAGPVDQGAHRNGTPTCANVGVPGRRSS